MTRRALFLALLAWPLAGGCELDIRFGPAVVNRCSESEQCASGECVGGMCITPSLDAPMKIFFEVIPPNDELTAPRAPFVFAPLEITEPRVVDLELPPETIASGGAFYVEDTLGKVRVPVQVTFTPRRDFAEAPAAPVHVRSDAEDYAILLEAGALYDIAVEPTGVSVPALSEAFGIAGGPTAALVFPPLYYEGVSADAIPSFDYVPELFSSCTPLMHSGCVLGGSVKSVDAAGEAIYEEGLLVRAVDFTGRVVSSSMRTDANGAFEIAITPGAGEYVIRVSPPDDVTLPRVEVPVDYTLTADSREITLPRLAAVPLTNYVGYYIGDVPYAVDHAAVAFESVALDVLGLPGDFSFRRTVFTETPDSGPSPFSLEVFPGRYRVVVTPAEADRAGVLVFEIDIDERSAEPGIQGQNYLLPLRTRMLGAARAPFGQAVPSAWIRALRVASASWLSAGDIARFGRSSETVSDAEGAFVLPLDVGTFDIVARPGADTGYAWQVVPDVLVTEDQADFGMDVPLVAPVPVSGTVRDDSGALLVGASVRVHAIFGSGEQARAIQIGEAETDGSGEYDVLLPAGL